jgi:hypothetical protein
MQVSVGPAGKEIDFKLARLNYASAHATVKAGSPMIDRVVGNTFYAPRDREKSGDGLERLIWVFPPEWTDNFPNEIRFLFTSGPAKGICLAQVSGAHGMTRSQDPVWPDAIAMADYEGHRAPFPPGVVRQVGKLARTGADPGRPWDEATVVEFIAELKRVRQLTRRTGYASPLARYLGYLKRMENAVQYALRNFPDINTTAMRAERDHAIATDPDEMMTIIHHLYVLRATGVEAAFAEFGCFKGFSTSCLSRACAELRMPMHVFDSFQGLPPSAGGRYFAGEYSASLDEVRHHVADFGVPEAITWHRGFFSQTMQAFREPLACIWMDVDLEESARDVMTGLSLLDERGCIFSHEIGDKAFIDGLPNKKRIAAGHYEVLGPISHAVEGRAGEARGEYLVSSLGVVYLPGSIRVLPYAHVAALLALVD